MRHQKPSNVSVEMHDMRCDYEAAKRTSRFQRRRRGVPTMGAGADFHYRSEGDFLWLQEVARDIHRNDMVIGQMTERAVINTIGGGFTPNPNTGDKELDIVLKERWAEESVDPDYCDLEGELTFYEQEKAVLRDMLVAGDIFATPTRDGTVQMLESHRCRNPQRTNRNMVHGVELERGTRRRRAFYFTREAIDPNKQAALKIGDMHRVDARDADGEALVWQVLNPKRVSQTRGVTAYAPVIIPAGMFDDLNFATLLKAQQNAFWLLVRNRSQSFFDTNPVSPAMGVPNDGFTGTRRVEDIAPGSEICGAAGETITAWNPNIPNAEFFQHARLILTIIGCNIGMPLVLALMDGSETNFSGFRGAVDQARMGFRDNQTTIAIRFHRPYWRFKLNYWADEDPILGAARERLGKNFYKHGWRRPGWPYIEPYKDAMADLVRDAHMQTSPRRRCAERGGMEWSEIVAETVEDRRLAIETALEAAKKLNSQYQLEGGPDVVSWRDLAPLPTPERVTVALTADAGEPTPANNTNAEPARKPAA